MGVVVCAWAWWCARGRGGVLAAVVWSSEARRISHACCKPTADAQTAAHGRGRSPEVQSSKRRGVQQLGVLGHRVQRQGSSSEFWGTESRGRAADQQAEKLLTSLKTEKAPVWVSVGCRKRWPRPLRSIHRGAEKAGTGIRGSPRTGRAAENSPPLRSLMIS